MCWSYFEQDPETEQVVMIGEIGGTDEEKAAEFIASTDDQARDRVHRRADCPARQAHGPCRCDHQRRQGHGCGQDRALQAAGVRVARHPGEIAEIVGELM